MVFDGAKIRNIQTQAAVRNFGSKIHLLNAVLFKFSLVLIVLFVKDFFAGKTFVVLSAFQIYKSVV